LAHVVDLLRIGHAERQALQVPNVVRRQVSRGCAADVRSRVTLVRHPRALDHGDGGGRRSGAGHA
jgi:hypothetical protein